MMRVNEVSRLTGLSIRTLRYYDSIGLLKPTAYTQAGYRLYDETVIERLQQILLFRELEFPLTDIKRIIDSPDFDKNKALEQQIELLTLKRNHFENLINYAETIKQTGEIQMDFSVFDKKKIDEYSIRAKEQWGETEAYKEYEKKSVNQSADEQKETAVEFMQLFTQFGQMKLLDPSDKAVQLQVKKLQDYISAHYYNCTDDILRSLGKMYSAGGEFTENIDKAGGEGTAVFSSKAIEIYCNK